MGLEMWGLNGEQVGGPLGQPYQEGSHPGGCSVLGQPQPGQGAP